MFSYNNNKSDALKVSEVVLQATVAASELVHRDQTEDSPQQTDIIDTVLRQDKKYKLKK